MAFYINNLKCRSRCIYCKHISHIFRWTVLLLISVKILPVVNVIQIRGANTWFLCSGIIITYFCINLSEQCCFDNITKQTTTVYPRSGLTPFLNIPNQTVISFKSTVLNQCYQPMVKQNAAKVKKDRLKGLPRTSSWNSLTSYIFIKQRFSDFKVELCFASNVSTWRLSQNRIGLMSKRTFNFHY